MQQTDFFDVSPTSFSLTFRQSMNKDVARRLTVKRIAVVVWMRM